MIKNIIIGIAAMIAVVSAGLFLNSTNDISTVIDKPAGAVSSPTLMSPYFSFGGVRQWARSTGSLTQATTTVCAIQSPAATSTLEMGSIQFTVSSTTASTVTLAKASTPYATTTSLGSHAVAANAQATILATTTATVGIGDKTIFEPSTYFVVGMAGGTGTFSPTGTCKAVWIEN